MLQLWSKMESHHATWKVEVHKCCTYHLQESANTMKHERVYLPFVADAMQNLSISRCNLMLHDEHMANATQNLFFFLCLFELDSCASFLPLGFAKLYGLLGFTNSNHNSKGNNSNNNKNYYYNNNNCDYNLNKTAAVTTTTAATRITKQTRIHNYVTDNNQQPTTNNNLQISCQMEDSSSKMLQTVSECKYHAKWKVPAPKCCTWLATWRVPTPKCCK